MKASVLSGIDSIRRYGGLLKGRRIGLMTNPTGVSRSLESTIDILRREYHLSALLACEHGVRGDKQAGEAVDTYRDPDSGVMVYSTYSQPGHRMSAEMLDQFDILVFDIQDVGARFYTYLYSLAYALEACAKAGKPVLVLDRVNPLSGARSEGTILDARFASFVGDYGLPTRTGLTIGEFARYARAYLKLDVDLTVAELTGWERRMYLDGTGLPWVAPSPNCHSLGTALCYIGTCIFEGVNISEGRGTTQPFELIGAPFVDNAELERRMNKLNLPGVHFRRTAFVPRFSKYKGELCRGVQLHITNRDEAEVFLAGLLLLETLWEMHPEHLDFLSWDNGRSFALDKLLGTDAFRRQEMTAFKLAEAHRPKVKAFREAVLPFLLYQ